MINDASWELASISGRVLYFRLYSIFHMLPPRYLAGESPDMERQVLLAPEVAANLERGEREPDGPPTLIRASGPLAWRITTALPLHR